MGQNTRTTVIPFLIVKNGKQAIEFYKAGFGAKEIFKYDMPNGKLSAKFAIDGAEFYLGDEEPEYGNLSPETIGGTAVRIVLTVNDPDTIFSTALKAARIATSVFPNPTSPQMSRSIGRTLIMSALVAAIAVIWSGVSS